MNNQTAIGLAVFFLVILVLFLLYSSNRQKGQNDMKRALFERFGTAQDLGAFLQSEGGRRFLADLSTGASNPLASVMASVQQGIILCLLGPGCIGGSAMIGSQGLLALGMVLTFVGVGFLVSAWVTRRLSVKWGLVDKSSDSDRQEILGK